jgi:hypothetical protein
MGGLPVAMDIKFFFQERIHRLIDIEGRSRGAAYTQAIVEIKTARALHEKLNTRTTYLSGH